MSSQPTRHSLALVMGALLAAALVPAYAQEVSPGYRVESLRREQHEVIPMGEAGALVITHDARDTAWHLQWLTRELKPGWADSFDPEVNLTLADWDVEGGRAWLVLGNRAGRVFTLQVDPSRGVVEAREERSPVRVRSLGELVVVGSDLYLSARSKLSAFSDGWLLHRTLGDEALTEVDLSETLPGRRAWVTGPTKVAGVPQVVATTPRPRDRVVSVSTLEGGAVQGSHAFASDGEHTVITGTSVRRADWDFVVGTYTNGVRGGAQGLVVYGARGDETVFQRFHSFTSFSDFFSYLPERRQERVEQRAQRRKAQGDDLDLSYNIVLDDLQLYDDHFLVVAEAYVPVYHTETRTQTSVVNGVTTTTTTYVQVFDGWRPTHAFVASFDLEGQLQWDATVGVGWGLVRKVEPRLDVQVDGDDVQMCFPIGDRLYTRVVSGGVAQPAPAADQAFTKLEQDDVRAAWETESAPWYGGRFLVWGDQRVVGDEGKQRVFAVSELVP